MSTGTNRWRRLILAFTLVVLAVEIGMFLYSLPGYKIGVDEAWLGEQAYFLANDGAVRSEMPLSPVYAPATLVVYHKLHIWLGAIAIKMFGLNLSALRMITLFSALLLFVAIGRYTKRYSLGLRREWVIPMIVLLSTPVLFSRMHFYRPELLVALLGFASFYSLRVYLENGRSIFLLLAGGLAGLATLGHLNGLIFIAAGLILLLFRHQYRGLVLFGIVAAITCSFYTVDSIGSLDRLWYQFTHNQGDQARDLGLTSPLFNLLSEHKRLFRSPMIGGITVLYLIALFDQIRTRRFLADPINLYSLLLIICLGLTGHNKTAKYGVLLFPFMALMFSRLVGRVSDRSAGIRSWYRVAIVAALMIHVGLGFGYNLADTLSSREYGERRHEKVAAKLHPKATVIAPMKFMYNQLGNFRIRGYEGMRHEIEEGGQLFDFKSMKERAAQSRVDHILVDLKFDQGWYPEFQNDGLIGDPEYPTADTIAGYLILTIAIDSVKIQRDKWLGGS